MWNIRESSTTRLLRPGYAPGPAGTPARVGTVPTLGRRRSIPPAAIVLALGGLLGAMPAQAFEFGEGEFQGSLDTTISHGLTYRVGKRDPLLAGKTNSNDGNLNYSRGVVSNTSKFTTDLDIGTGDFGAFVRASGFIDFENQNGERERTELSEDAKERVGRNLELLDAYVTGTFDVGDTIVDARIGRHVLNWGESTFIPNGINAINPFDVSKLRLPGSELREALLPVGLASLSVAPTDTLSVEGFYQFEWEETEIDAVGSYFSVTDYVGPGAREAVLQDIADCFVEGVDIDADCPTTEGDWNSGFGPLTPAINADIAGLAGLGLMVPLLENPDRDFATVLRGPDRVPEDSGQWGLALRYLAEDLNDTEFGFYFMNYHSRLPIVGAKTSSPEVLRGAMAAANAVLTPGSHTQTAIGTSFTQAARALAQVGVMTQVELGLIDRTEAPAAIEMAIQELLDPVVVREFVEATVGSIAVPLAIDRYTDRTNRTGEYFLEYPEDIGLFGVSFNTVLGTSGWALQGEYSLRPDAPLQRAERSVLTEGLKPVIDALGMAGCASNPLMEDCPRNPANGQPLPPQFFQESLTTHLGTYRPRKVQGYVERDVSQIQATATRVFGPVLGADGLVFLTEAALMHVHDMPDKIDEPLESPAGGVLTAAGAPNPEKADADATSWGYRVAARLDYNNAIGSVNLFPYAQFLHDVSGNSPAPSGPFVEGRTAVTLGLRADYLSRWQADLGYTQYAGDGYDLSDRDFISASVKYSF